MALREDVGFSRAADELGVHPTMLYRWWRQSQQTVAVTSGGSGSGTSVEAELEEARRRIRVLEMERDILDAAWQGPYSQGGGNPPQVTARHGPDIQPWRYIGNDVLHA